MREEVEKQEEEQAEYEIEIDSGIGEHLELIQAAYFGLSAVEDIDIEILPNKIMRDRIRRIKRQCIRIIDNSIGELYDYIFEEDEE